MTTFPILQKSDLKDPDQLTFWDELTLGPRGFYTGGPDSKRLPDLYNAWMQFPEFGQLILKIGEEVRTHDRELPGNLRELVVLTTSAILGARVEYEFHIPFAKDQGLADDVIAAIGEGKTPTFTKEVERVVYEANVQFIRTATLTEKIRDDVIRLLGFQGMIHLIAAVTLYVATAYTTNVARVKLADGFSADPNKLKDFFAGRQVE
jgi:4-carboxymuconolactone decarboxylase